MLSQKIITCRYQCLKRFAVGLSTRHDDGQIFYYADSKIKNKLLIYTWPRSFSQFSVEKSFKTPVNRIQVESTDSNYFDLLGILRRPIVYIFKKTGRIVVDFRLIDRIP